MTVASLTPRWLRESVAAAVVVLALMFVVAMPAVSEDVLVFSSFLAEGEQSSEDPSSDENAIDGASPSSVVTLSARMTFGTVPPCTIALDVVRERGPPCGHVVAPGTTVLEA